jgi:hypothetical protein
MCYLESRATFETVEGCTALNESDVSGNENGLASRPLCHIKARNEIVDITCAFGTSL